MCDVGVERAGPGPSEYYIAVLGPSAGIRDVVGATWGLVTGCVAVACRRVDGAYPSEHDVLLHILRVRVQPGCGFRREFWDEVQCIFLGTVVEDASN